MKINKDFILRNVGNKYVAVPVGKTYETFRRFIKMNESAKFIWEELVAGKTDAEIVQEMSARYEITEDHAQSSYRDAIAKMAEAGMLVE